MDEQVNKSVVAANRAATAARVAAIKAVQNRMDGKFCDLGLWKLKRGKSSFLQSVKNLLLLIIM